MALLILSFIAMLSITFVLIISMTRRSAMDKTIDKRMDLIHASMGDGITLAVGSQQFLLATKRAGTLGLLDEILLQFKPVRNLSLRIMQANSSTSVSAVILSSLGLAIVVYAVTWFFVPVALVDSGAAIASCLLPYWIISFKRSRRINSFNAVLADTIDMLARALRAGYSMSGSIEMVSENAQEPAGTEFKEIFRQQNLGLPFRDALLQLLDRFPSLDLRVLVTAILVQKDTGGNLAEILDRTVFVIRDRLRIQGEIRVQTAQGRLTGWILSALPVVMFVLINLVNPGYSSILLTEPIGRKMIYISIGMLSVGTYIIHRIVNGIEV